MRLRHPGASDSRDASIDAPRQPLPAHTARLGRDVAHVELPGTTGDSDSDARAASIAQTDAAEICGWIVDLRRNNGGPLNPRSRAASVPRRGRILAASVRKAACRGPIRRRDKAILRFRADGAGSASRRAHGAASRRRQSRLHFADGQTRGRSASRRRESGTAWIALTQELPDGAQPIC